MKLTMSEQLGQVTTLSLQAPYCDDPQKIFETVCTGKSNTVLLESAEIDAKAQVKSILLTQAAVKIVCNANQVTLNALTLNGEAVLAFLTEQFSQQANIELGSSATQLIIKFTATTQSECDEFTRLQQANVLEVLRVIQQLTNINHHPFAVFLAGVFAFDLMEIAEQLPEVTTGDNSCPDYVFYLAQNLVVLDHQKRQCELIGQIFSGQGQQKCYFDVSHQLAQLNALLTEASLSNQLETKIQTVDHQVVNTQNVTCNISDDDFKAQVIKLKQHIVEGDIFQVVPSRCFSLPCHDTLAAYQQLKQQNPSPYMFYLQDNDFTLFGASPESALKYQQSSRQVELYPIAGTRRRGRLANGELSLDLDSRIELELRQDSKELAEHIMLVDLARNDIARISQAGTRFVKDLLKVDRYSHVMHLVSRVCGTLKPELDALHAYQACMNMGTLSGAPKVKATSLIREVEQQRRGSYGGAVGYLTGDGDMDTCIVIRSAFVKNQTAYVQAGAGVVFDSEPQAEADETRQKAQAVLTAISLANNQVAKEQLHD